jgi:hypothetical protein
MDAKTWQRVNKFDAIMTRLNHKFDKKFKEIEERIQAESDAFLSRLDKL